MEKTTQIIPYAETLDEEDNQVYLFRFSASTGNKIWETRITIDELNDNLLIERATDCTCPQNQIRKLECKHLIESKRILKDCGIDWREK